MYLSDDEIIELIIKKKRKKKRRQRVIRRVSFLLICFIVFAFGIGTFINKQINKPPRGIIFIDPAHGGVDAGSFVGKRYEKDDTLTFALAVRDELINLNFKVYMSRESDKDVDVNERGKMANNKNADLFVSIHRNKAEEGSGVEIYIPSTNEEASRLLANNIYNAMKSCGFDGRDVRRGSLLSEKEDYAENSTSNMPSCLVELGFLQNKNDNKLFDENLKENAEAFATAISDTFAKLYEPES